MATLTLSSFREATAPSGPVHLAIGMFDGVHLGHQAVIGAAVESARRDNGTAGVLTFFPHPSRLFTPASPTELILTPDVKRWLLMHKAAVDFEVEEPFTREFAAIPAVEFVEFIAKQIPRLAGIYVGENWRFGRGRAGDAELLKTLCDARGIRMFSAPRVSRGGEPISSTRIRDLVSRGDMAAARALLGYDYTSIGTVLPGRRLGRTIGFPTLNLPWEPECRPALGVYEVRVSSVDGSERLPGVANYGVRPTVEERSVPLLEVHILGETNFGEGDSLRVEWCRYERGEMKFAAIDALRAQIALDRDRAVRYFATGEA